jgi:hypothetical protein
VSPDEAWRDLAKSSRTALRLLGYDGPDCLPDDPAPCGGSFFEHASAHLGALQAVVEHHLTHAGPAGQDIADRTEIDVLGAVTADCQDQFHGQRNSGADQ